jgi:hypothetical protein
MSAQPGDPDNPRPLDSMGRPIMSLTALAGGTDRPPIPPPPDRQDWKAMPTKYGGIEFRSRLEARWACFFDRIGWKWTYEPLDGNAYIPDFLVHVNHAVKLAAFVGELMRSATSKLQRMSPIEGDDYHRLLAYLPALEAVRYPLLQLSPVPTLLEVKPAVTKAQYRAAIPKMTTGLAGRWDGQLWIVGADPLPAWEWEPGEPAYPRDWPPLGLVGSRRDGAGWDFGVHFWWPGAAEPIRAAWAAACNATKWRPS